MLARLLALMRAQVLLDDEDDDEDEELDEPPLLVLRRCPVVSSIAGGL
jgi:hypothetical protein